MQSIGLLSLEWHVVYATDAIMRKYCDKDLQSVPRSQISGHKYFSLHPSKIHTDSCQMGKCNTLNTEMS